MPEQGYFTGAGLFVRLDPIPNTSVLSNVYYDNYNRYQIKHTFIGGARPAEDDRIRFEGIGATLYAPCGRGQATYDGIMAAIKDGTPE